MINTLNNKMTIKKKTVLYLGTGNERSKQILCHLLIPACGEAQGA
jgi:hypothetical protein